ncbi:hypothetical protein COCC4DRAFT_57694 [Bipolaris maydis ATCC 48331]|uniref:Uncharacterized protein n=2 Tax=Cochliobolus heterostrophus TaxID=5016 RepID=M2U9S8_COCH5|nr:uncharacterized protein COCC4DRAFT_57694 [Bipolaris maydis ATCC 48331]EMD84733.1 hypothetical protein COCHEDRAFT_1121720 [Bipolaris maydis C5]ENI07827.1 hypothetical protein COCC4DRAFT_57694 [Bipolaris maydis ATCC 48331]
MCATTFRPCGCTRDKRGCWIDWLRTVPSAEKLYQQRVQWRQRAAQHYLQQMDRFLELPCLAVHLTDGQPRRDQSYFRYAGVTALRRAARPQLSSTAKSRLPLATTRHGGSSTYPR